MLGKLNKLKKRTFTQVDVQMVNKYMKKKPTHVTSHQRNSH